MAAVVPGRSARGLPFLAQVGRGQGSPEPGSQEHAQHGLRTDLRASTDPLAGAPA